MREGLFANGIHHLTESEAHHEHNRPQLSKLPVLQGARGRRNGHLPY